MRAGAALARAPKPPPRKMRRKLSEVDRGAATSGDESMFEGLWGLEALHSPRTPFKWEHLIALAIVFVSLVAGRWLYDGFFRLLRRDSTPPFQLANELTKRDNKALSISFAGFIAGLGLVTVGSLDGLKVQTDGLGKYILTFVVYIRGETSVWLALRYSRTLSGDTSSARSAPKEK